MDDRVLLAIEAGKRGTKKMKHFYNSLIKRFWSLWLYCYYFECMSRAYACEYDSGIRFDIGNLWPV